MSWLTVQNVASVAGMLTGGISLWLILKSRQAEKRTRERGIDAVYLLINLEIRHNLERLWKLCDELSLKPPCRSQSEKEVDQRAFTLANTNMPTWTKLMWEAHATRVNDALDAFEITRVMSLYERLERLNYLHIEMIKAHAVAFQEGVPVFGYTNVTVSSAQDMEILQRMSDKRNDAKEAAETRLEKYREFEELAVDIMTDGNPLADDQGFTKPPSQRGFIREPRWYTRWSKQAPGWFKHVHVWERQSTMAGTRRGDSEGSIARYKGKNGKPDRWYAA